MIGWTAVAVAAALSVLLIAARWFRWIPLVVAAVAAAFVAFVYLTSNLVDLVTMLQALLPDSIRSEQVPTAVTAWLLATVGSLAAMFGMAPLRSGRGAMSVPIAVALVVATAGSAVAVWAGLRAGDDDRFVDATRAAEVPVPAVPATLGEQVFSMKVSDRDDFDSSRGTDVSVGAAGAGFVTLHDGTLTAYDAAGAPRWHFRRTGPGEARVTDANVYDQGRTVILRIGGRIDRRDAPALVALDAMTGEQLWTSTDTSRVEAFGSGGNSNMWPTEWSWPVRYLVARGEDRWVSFDPRTGAELWDIPRPSICEGEVFTSQVVEGTTAILLLTQCSNEGLFSVAASRLDPRTGAITGSVPVVERVAPVADRRYLDLRFVPAGDEGAVYSVQSGSGEARGHVTAAGKVTPTDIASSSVTRNVGVTNDFVAGWTIFDSSGVQRCRIAGEVSEEPNFASSVGWLGEDLVIAVDAEPVLRSYDRQTCAPTRAMEQPWGSVHGIGVAPGVFLVMRTDREGTHLDGYS